MLHSSRRFHAILVFLLWPLFTAAQPTGHGAIELVESVPLETLLDDPDTRNTREVWLEMINGADSTLDIEQFYIANNPGESLDTVIGAITNAARRGVRVRVIVDSRMYRTYPETADSLRSEPHVAVRVIDFGKIAGGIQHAKYFIVDGRSLFIGSQNFDWRSITHIRELGLRIEDDRAVQFVRSVFETDWRLAETNNPAQIGASVVRRHSPAPLLLHTAGGDPVLIAPTGSPRTLIPDSLAWDEPQIVHLIDGAQEELCLQFLSYARRGRDNTDYPVLDEALRRAAARGVNVKMVVADWEKATPAEQSLKGLSALPNIEVRFSVIPEWSGGYVAYARVEHCKFVLADGGRFWLGTSNAEKSYFHTSRNLGVVGESKALGGDLRRFFLRGWNGPYVETVTKDGIYEARRHGGE